MNPTCDTCRFWDNVNQCRRYPPQTNGEIRTLCTGQGLYNHQVVFWPRPSASDWCGEHQPKPQTVNQYSSEVER